MQVNAERMIEMEGVRIEVMVREEGGEQTRWAF